MGALCGSLLQEATKRGGEHRSLEIKDRSSNLSSCFLGGPKQIILPPGTPVSSTAKRRVGLEGVSVNYRHFSII